MAGLARLIKIPHQRLSEYERGFRLPPAHVCQRILEILEVAVPCAEAEFAARDLGRLGAVQRFQLATYPGDAWKRHALSYQEEVRQLRPVPVVPEWFPARVRCDSALEVLAWLQLLSAGARAGLYSPLRMGFRGQSIVTLEGEPLGERDLPCLYLPALRMCIWPQVSMRVDTYVFRCDGLVAVLKKGRKVWHTLEIDGPERNVKRDKFRADRVGLREWRFSAEQVLSLRLVEWMAAKLAG
jgi:transcriptional regulator with XRE-family HTH domain